MTELSTALGRHLADSSP